MSGGLNRVESRLLIHGAPELHVLRLKGYDTGVEVFPDRF